NLQLHDKPSLESPRTPERDAPEAYVVATPIGELGGAVHLDGYIGGVSYELSHAAVDFVPIFARTPFAGLCRNEVSHAAAGRPGQSPDALRRLARSSTLEIARRRARYSPDRMIKHRERVGNCTCLVRSGDRLD